MKACARRIFLCRRAGLRAVVIKPTLTGSLQKVRQQVARRMPWG
jgi:O-succinylbenzoate synthase